MKTILTILLLSFFFTGHSQTIDDLVKNYNIVQIDSFSKTLDYSHVVDGTKTGIFNVDTIQLSNGDFKFFSFSLTMTSGAVVAEGAYLFCVRNNNGVYSIPVIKQPLSAWNGTTSVSITPVLINNNTMCVIKIITGNLTIQFHYTRSEFK